MTMQHSAIKPSRSEAKASAATTRTGILQRKCACGGGRGPSGECAACREKRTEVAAFRFQPKLKVNEPDDLFEREADQMADHVMRMADPHPGSNVRRTEDAISASIAKEKSGLPTHAVAPGFDAGMRALGSGGQPLSPSLRSFFEPRFGHDFSKVRVHRSPRASQMASAVQAKAFTVGPDVVFGTRQYAPQTYEGKHLLAHELTHVVQQGAASRANTLTRPAPVQRTAASDRGDQGTLRPGAYGIRLVLPSGEKFIGPPIFSGALSPGPTDVEASHEPLAEEELQRIEQNAPMGIARTISHHVGKRIQRRASFTNPIPVPQDPLARLVSGSSPGLTTPTINGNVVANSAQVLTQISPTSVTGSASKGSTTCQFDPGFTINTSANVIVASSPGAGGWTGSVTPALLGNPPACTAASIPATMVAPPANTDFVTRVANSENEHVTAIRELHDRHFVPYDTFVTGLHSTGPTLPACAANLQTQLGLRPTQAGMGFVLGYAAETERLDGPGGTHEDTAVPAIAPGCSSVTLTVSQTNPPIPSASRGNVVRVAPTVTSYDHMYLSVSGNDVVETSASGAAAPRVIHHFSNAANARVGLHAFLHYGTTSKNTIGNMTFLLVGNAAPSGTGSTLSGVTEESIDPARFQVTFGVPGASDWAITQIDGNRVRTIVNFGAQRNEAFSSVEVLRRLGVTKLSFVGTRSSRELMFFRR